MKWIEGLKIYNKDKAKWCIPKKGSAGYIEVKAIMAGEETPKQRKRIAPITSGIDVATAMEQNQKRRSKLFDNFEYRMKVKDLGKRIKDRRKD